MTTIASVRSNAESAGTLAGLLAQDAARAAVPGAVLAAASKAATSWSAGRHAAPLASLAFTGNAIGRRWKILLVPNCNLNGNVNAPFSMPPTNAFTRCL